MTYNVFGGTLNLALSIYLLLLLTTPEVAWFIISVDFVYLYLCMYVCQMITLEFLT